MERTGRPKVYGFPGQGSQRRGMGRELFERFPAETAIADRVLGYPIAELCLNDPERRLNRTEFTQPALYVVSALAYLDQVARDPVAPDCLVGHSLGEYTALFAAGVFDFETGLRLVQPARRADGRRRRRCDGGGGRRERAERGPHARRPRVRGAGPGQPQRPGPVRRLRPAAGARSGLRRVRGGRRPHRAPGGQRAAALTLHAPGG